MSITLIFTYNLRQSNDFFLFLNILDTKLTLWINFTLPSHKKICIYWKNQAAEDVVTGYSNDEAHYLDYRWLFSPSR